MDKYTFRTTPQANAKAIVSGPNYRFTVLTDRLVRYEWVDEPGKFEDRASTFAIHRDFPVPEFRVVDKGGDLEIITPYLHLSYNKKRFSPDGLLVDFNSKFLKHGGQWRYGDAPEGNLGATARTLDMVDGRCDMGHGPLSRRGYAALDDSNSMLFDGKGFVAGRLAGDRVDGYLFCYGQEYRAAMKAFYALSGKQPELPRYALGNWWSRYHAYRQEEYLQLMDTFRARDIPMSVAVIDMDWHYVSDERVPHSGWTGYTWDKNLFPDPVQFGRELHDRNLKITLNDHPHQGIHSHEDPYEEMARALGHDTRDKTPILFDPTSPKFMEAYLGILHRNLENIACDFWWIDWQQGLYSKVPGMDPLWLLNHFHFLDHARQGNIPIIFSRYAGPGSHRYPIGFSGDTVVTWASLQFQPEFTATASNIGYGWWSHDIGGHLFGGRDDELVTRWVQLGVFSPIMRLHSTQSHWMSKEPWLYRAECESVMSTFLRLRHRLVPFLYTRNIICARDDEPLVQPMYWHHPYRAEAYTVPNQYYFGADLLVAPIVHPRNSKTSLAAVQAWLPPPHRHVDIFTGTVYDADHTVTFYRPLDGYPVLAHEGSIIPLDADAAPRNGCLNPNAFEVLVVVGQDGRAEILEDARDDASPDAPAAGPHTQTIAYTQKEGILTAHITDHHRPWTFRFLALTALPDKFKLSIDGVDRTADTSIRVDRYPQVASVVVTCPAVGAEQKQVRHVISIELGPDPQLAIIDATPRIEHLLMTYQIEYTAKDRIWEIVQSAKANPINVTVSRLMGLGHEEAIVGPILELLLADSRSAA
ncbi:hypothetical protein ASPZODRAFT_126696 [Penicilliopsis zonata CBS 506.65]|uniref:alpha-glucosidase n=1 Tax=Penicilliopsis zonata CBS 506.65 TaxID=1073090 RepID=A0A1L9SUF7_9EURO|nr:hypothetical protein ASPZODRAFT_126696 [Penicilliopsis zonata CBS 506.65]OJJ50766.1 hypothetical protein ASPZODRAFT_126696 [Penicilliopsis zonata CBS 506.65]